MGILDDAIREHLELKRQHGAEDEDVERLEQEAFGPVARPGDPEFATGEEPAAEPPSEEQPAAEPPSEEQPAAGAPAAEPPSQERPVTETGEWGEPSAEVAEPPSDEAPAAEAPAAGEPASGSFGIFDVEADSAAAETPAERARIEHPHLDDTADHPGPVQLGPEAEAEPEQPAAGAATPEPAAAPDAAESPEPTASEPDAAEVAEPEPAATPEAPEADIFADDDFGLEDVDLTVSDDEPPSAEQPAAGEGEEGEDLLEETPDFLQESEGEDLWFEQGPPRDFDFDDD